MELYINEWTLKVILSQMELDTRDIPFSLVKYNLIIHFKQTDCPFYLSPKCFINTRDNDATMWKLDDVTNQSSPKGFMPTILQIEVAGNHKRKVKYVTSLLLTSEIRQFISVINFYISLKGIW